MKYNYYEDTTPAQYQTQVPRQQPSIAVDGLVIKNERILLIKRTRAPFKNYWALPGGFVEYGESLSTAIKREIQEETTLQTIPLKIIGVFSNPGRDPRGHTITAAFLMTLRNNTDKPQATDEARQVKYFPLLGLPRRLAFDHREIIEDALASRTPVEIFIASYSYRDKPTTRRELTTAIRKGEIKIQI